MDVTPKLLEDVEFRAVFRGYDPEEVDDFLERVAVAFAQLHERLRDATEQVESANSRTARAEARARESSDGDDTLRRTLVLAQRTADAAIKEAEESAAAIVEAAETQARQHYAATEERATHLTQQTEETAKTRESQAQENAAERLRVADAQAQATLSNAREQASRLLVDARQKADRILADADTAAIRQAEQKLARLTDDVESLEVRRDALAEDVQTLDQHARTHRERLTDALTHLRQVVEGPSALTHVTLPPLRSGDLASALEAHAARQVPRDGAGPSSTAPSPSRPERRPTSFFAPGSAPDLSADDGTVAGSEIESVIDMDALAAQTPQDSGIEASAGTDDHGDGPTNPGTDQDRPSRVPPQARPASERPSTGLRSPMESGGSPAAAAPPWVGLAPPPPPPPPSGLSRGEGSGTDAGPGTPPPRPSATTVILDTPRAAEDDGEGDTFLEELRRAVGDHQDDDDDATRFFEDRDPTDPALRFFEGSEDLRSRFRRR